MALADFQFAGLHLFHWLLAALLPLALIMIAVIAMIRSGSLRRALLRESSRLTGKIDVLEGRSIKLLPAIDDYFQESPLVGVRLGFARLRQDSQNLYGGRWLPDPRLELSPGQLAKPGGLCGLSFLAAGSLLPAGLLGTLAELLVQHWFAPPAGLVLPLILLPACTGLAASMLAGAAAYENRRRMDDGLRDLVRSLERHLPVYGDQSGTALLIDNFHEYDRAMKDTLQQFTATAARLAESDMADGIRRSIEQVLLDSVAPSIQQASSALGALASELVNRQERGMQELAVRFASALSSEIASNLQPVNREITQMGSLMADVRNYIEYAMHALETVRQQAGGLLSDTSGALREMSAARIQLVDDFSQVDKRLQQLVASTSEMAAIYHGNDQNLGSIVEHVSRQMGEYSQNLGLINGEAIRAMQEAREAAYVQNDSAGQYLSAMQNQVNQLTTQLSTDIRALLDEIHSEASGIATQTEIIGSQLGSLNAALENSLTNFTQESTRYVRQTLASLDGSMAELASRIAGTAAELRDAVDALPQSLRQAVTTPDPGSQRV